MSSQMHTAGGAHKDYKYDVALSFADEDRTYVEEVAESLTSTGIKVFYDKYYGVQLWGEDLVARLAQIYSTRARYCVMFISQHYVRKAWTNHERQHAQARALVDEGYILPVRFDDTSVPGLPDTVRYVDARRLTPEALAALIQQKLALPKDTANAVQEGRNASVSSPVSTYLPKFPKQRTEKERDDYLEESFRFVTKYFQDALEQVKHAYSSFDYSFNEIHRQKFVCRAYVNGEAKEQCKIWIGGLFRSNAICFAEGRFDINHDNTMNDWLPVADRDGVIGFQISLPATGRSGSSETLLSQTQMAEYLWQRFMRPLEHGW